MLFRSLSRRLGGIYFTDELFGTWCIMSCFIEYGDKKLNSDGLFCRLVRSMQSASASEFLRIL